ncbi:MAG: hypothetical protein RLZZ292_70 [Bacteroidota bacterium]|jgi:hypothetical protein
MLKKLLKTWLIGVLPTLLIVVGQTISGKYEGQSDGAWAWFLVNTVPSIALLTYVFFNKKNLILDKKYSILIWLSVFYVLILLFSLLSQPFASASALEILHQSEYWLGPIQLLFLGGLSFAVFSNENYESIEAIEETDDYDQNDLRSLLAHNQLEKVFERLKPQLDAEQQTTLLLLENRYNTLQQSKQKGIITNENASIEHNRIVVVLEELMGTF